MSSPPHILRTTHSQYFPSTSRNINLPKVSKRSLRDIEIVRNLSITETNKPLSLSFLNIKNKQKIDSNPEIKLRRLNIRIEPSPTPSTSNTRLSVLEREFNSEKNKEFFIKYEKIKKEKQMEEKLKKAKHEVEQLKYNRNILYEQSVEILNKIYDYNLTLHVLDNDGYVLMKQREHERIAFSIEKQQQQTKREVIGNKNNQMKITTRKSTPTTKRKSAIKIDSFVLSTLNSRENKEKLEKKKGINKEKNKCYEALHTINESIKKIKEEINIKIHQRDTIQNELSNYYHNLLYEGLDVRQEGLCWIIKAIWQIGANVQLTYLPTFLDNESIDYLFTVAHKTVELKHIGEEIEKEKTKLQKDLKHVLTLKSLSSSVNNSLIVNGKNLFQTSVMNIPTSKRPTIRARRASMIAKKPTNSNNNKEYKVNHILNACEQRDKVETEENNKVFFALPTMKNIVKLTHKKDVIEKYLKEIKKKEMKRLFKLLITNEYERKNEVHAEIVIAALVGENHRDKEIQAYTKLKKNYLDSIKKVEFFSMCKKRNEMDKMHFAKFTNSEPGK